MLYRTEQAPTIAFPEPETPAEPLTFHSFGFRVNGLWLVRAQLPPCLPGGERRILGGLVLDIDFGADYRSLEPPIVNRHAHMWVYTQAEAAGLEVVGYQNLNSQAGNGFHSTAFAEFVVAQAGITPAAQ
jgi:hypothetical protein